MASLRIAALIVIPLLLLGTLAASPRFARLGAFEGSVQVQFEAADPWRPATPNLPLTEGTRIRTGPDARLEIELDDSGVFRMAGEGLAELTDYSRLSGGQKITVLSLDSGLAYFTGEPAEGSSIHLLVPGAQATLRQGSRIRLQALPASSEIAIVEGAAHFVIPTADMDLHQGQSARVTIPASSHFSLFREISPLDPDGWNEQLDKAEADTPASSHDLDRTGKWISTGDYGLVWQPPVKAGWAPYREGRWVWFQSLGFVWAADEPWGWKPYHEGRWLQHPDLGWVWVQGADDAPFSPGEVYWARGNNIAFWGPLAPGEQWTAAGPPRQFAALNTTAGAFVSGNREIVSGAELPKDLLKAVTFTSALPSPALPLARLTAPRDPLRTKQFTAVDVVPAVRLVTQATPPPDPPAETPTLVADVMPPVASPVDPDSPAGNPGTLPPGIVLLKSPRSRAVAVPAPPSTSGLRIGGTSLVKDLFPQWLAHYDDRSVQFNASGSGAAFRGLFENSVNLAILDGPLVDSQLQTLSSTQPVQIPIALDAVIIVYNINGFSGELKLTPEILAGIYLGEIHRWSDQRIVVLNPGAHLPNEDIVVMHRSDGCAATGVLTDYLSKVSSAWKNRAGAGNSIAWPITGLEARGDDALAVLVRQTPGAIGYLAQPLSAEAHLQAAWLKNRAGVMVKATSASLTAAAAANDSEFVFMRSATNAPGQESYPLTSVVWAVAPTAVKDPGTKRAEVKLLNWIVTTGQQQYGALAFAPLPPAAVALAQKLIQRIR